MNTKHSGKQVEKDIETEEEFNCADCDFQTTSDAHLKNRIWIKHTIICKICEKEFKEKSKLMQHRKKEHSTSVAPCRKFAENNCPFIEETCFWRHVEGQLNRAIAMLCLCKNF